LYSLKLLAFGSVVFREGGLRKGEQKPVSVLTDGWDGTAQVSTVIL